MIAEMKKVTIFINSSKTDEAIKSLGDLGVFHPYYQKKPESTVLDKLKAEIVLMERALELISEQSDKIPAVNTEDSTGLKYATELISNTEAIKTIKGELEALKNTLDNTKLWGSFSKQDIEELERTGLYLRLFKCKETDLDKLPNFAACGIISRENQTLCVALMHPDKSLKIPLEELPLPARLPEDLEANIKEKELELECLQKDNKRLYGKHGIIINAIVAQRAELECEQLKAGMSLLELGTVLAKEPLSIFSFCGFCPTDKLGVLNEVARECGWALMVEAPLESDPVPTLLRHPRWMETIMPVLRFTDLTPAYGDYDINAIFLIFLGMFTAFIIGDAGYGLMLLALTISFRRRIKAASSELFVLLSVMSASTIIWGAVTGAWFSVEALSGHPLLKRLIIPSLYVHSVMSEALVMRLCFFIGALQLTIAHIWRILRLYPSPVVFAEVGSVAIVCGFYYIACYFILGIEMPDGVAWLFLTAVVLILVFNEQNGGGFLKGLIRGVVRLPINLLGGVGSFSDIVSYIRLFAVGLAGMKVASTFNNIAVDIGASGGVLALMGAAFILIAGHSLNLAIAALSILVHGLRLNVLEFSKHLDMKWSGIVFKPFGASKNLNMNKPTNF